MVEEKEKEIIGYFTDDRNIYCTDCILKHQEQMKEKIEKAGGQAILVPAPKKPVRNKMKPRPVKAV